jgi:hypothetical protein
LDQSTEEGPWLFRQNIVCIEKYDGLARPKSVDLNFFSTWIQIHKLPIGYRNVALITNLTERKVGKVVSVETDVQGAGNFVRVQVKIDVRIVLGRFVTISRAGQREFYQIKFEKMPRFCGSCGFIGHSHLECGTCEHIEANLKWGDFLRADWETWRGRSYPGNHGGTQRGRGGQAEFAGEHAGRGRGRDQRGGRNIPSSWRHNALPYVEDHEQQEDPLADTGSSPVKPGDTNMTDRDSMESGVKRRLLLDNPVEENTMLEKENALALVVNDGNLPSTYMMEVETDKDQLKRSKKAGANSPSLGSAGSFKELVRSQ